MKLEELTVQTKFSDACSLEKENRVWNRIKDSLPPGQLSFILRAASDTLPTPLNLCRWKMHTDSKCSLCNSIHPIVNHILNACPTSLNKGRFTWRHDSVLQKLVRGIIPVISKKKKLYADLPDHRAFDNPHATIPQHIVTASALPDIVVIYGNKITLIELTVPYNSPEA